MHAPHAHSKRAKLSYGSDWHRRRSRDSRLLLRPVRLAVESGLGCVSCVNNRSHAAMMFSTCCALTLTTDTALYSGAVPVLKEPCVSVLAASQTDQTLTGLYPLQTMKPQRKLHRDGVCVSVFFVPYNATQPKRLRALLVSDRNWNGSMVQVMV